MTRRARMKAEGTFLESVRALLQQLTHELKEVKASIQQLGPTYVNGFDPFMDSCVEPFWGDWKNCEAWNQLGFEENVVPEPADYLKPSVQTFSAVQNRHASEKPDGAFGHVAVLGGIEKVDIAPKEAWTSFSKSSLLAYRGTVGGSASCPWVPRPVAQEELCKKCMSVNEDTNPAGSAPSGSSLVSPDFCPECQSANSDSSAVGSVDGSELRSEDRMADMTREREYQSASSSDVVGASLPILTTVAGSSPFNTGDAVIVIEGDLCGLRGFIRKPGGKFNVTEGSTVTGYESLCSVQLDDDPAKYTGKVFEMSQLEHYESTSRCELRHTVKKCLDGMEKVSLPEKCNKLLLPLLRKCTDTIDHGSADQCSRVLQIFSARLDQVMDEVKAVASN